MLSLNTRKHSMALPENNKFKTQNSQFSKTTEKLTLNGHGTSVVVAYSIV